MRPTFTLGIEEEYQTVDPESRDLRSHIATEMLAQGKLRLEERVKAEMHQSVIEVGTRVCRDIKEAQEDLFDLRRNMVRLAEDNGLMLVAGATHPFADWRLQEIYPDPRYQQESRISSRLRARISSSVCTSMSASRIRKPQSA